MRSSRLIAGSLAVAAISATVWWQLPHGHGAFFPQFRRDLRDHLWGRVSFALREEPEAAQPAAPAPAMPKHAVLPSAAAYKAALASGKQHPGATAFHADTDLFCEYNRKAVEDQARKEGVTVAEIKELTFFGFAAMRASQRPKVEEVLGHKLDDAAAQKLAALAERESESFTKQIHQLVDRGASEAQRWALINQFEQHFVDEFDSELGVTPEQFDHLLAPDANESAGAMAVPLPPEVKPPPLSPGAVANGGAAQPLSSSAPPVIAGGAPAKGPGR